MDYVIAVLIAAPLFAFFYFAIDFGYGKWVVLYLSILTALCYKAYSTGVKK